MNSPLQQQLRLGCRRAIDEVEEFHAEELHARKAITRFVEHHAADALWQPKHSAGVAAVRPSSPSSSPTHGSTWSPSCNPGAVGVASRSVQCSAAPGTAAPHRPARPQHWTRKKAHVYTFFTQPRPPNLPETGLSWNVIPDVPGKLKTELICALLAARLWDEPWRMREGAEGLRLLALEVRMLTYKQSFTKAELSIEPRDQKTVVQFERLPTIRFIWWQQCTY